MQVIWLKTEAGYFCEGGMDRQIADLPVMHAQMIGPIRCRPSAALLAFLTGAIACGIVFDTSCEPGARISGHRMAYSMANAIPGVRRKASAISSNKVLAKSDNHVRASRLFENQHRASMVLLISSGAAKITSARSPSIPAGTIAGAPLCGPCSLESVFRRRLRSQK